ncbi:hypothetical protein ACFPRL_08890 [Pseudoclavibacter helvolus]
MGSQRCSAPMPSMRRICCFSGDTASTVPSEVTTTCASAPSSATGSAVAASKASGCVASMSQRLPVAGSSSAITPAP